MQQIENNSQTVAAEMAILDKAETRKRKANVELAETIGLNPKKTRLRTKEGKEVHAVDLPEGTCMTREDGKFFDVIKVPFFDEEGNLENVFRFSKCLDIDWSESFSPGHDDLLRKTRQEKESHHSLV